VSAYGLEPVSTRGRRRERSAAVRLRLLRRETSLVHHSPDAFSAPRMLTDRTRLSRACSAVAKIVPASHARLSPLSTGGEPSSPTRGVTPTRRPMQFTSQRPKAATTPVLVRRRPRFDLERVPPCRFRIAHLAMLSTRGAFQIVLVISSSPRSPFRLLSTCKHRPWCQHTLPSG
jgi:hypothetical protein